MKSQLAFLLLFALPFSVLAQSEANRSLSLIGGPNISFLAGKNTGSFSKQSPAPGYQFRVEYERKVAERLWLRTGVGYSRVYYRAILDIPGLQWPSQNNNGQFDPTKPGEDIYLDREDDIISIPFGIRYCWSSHFYVDADASVHAVNRSTLIVRPGFGAAFGYQTAVKPNMNLFIQPAAGMLLNNPVDNGFQLKSLQLCTFSLEVGLRGFLH